MRGGGGHLRRGLLEAAIRREQALQRFRLSQQTRQADELATRAPITPAEHIGAQWRRDGWTCPSDTPHQHH